MMPKQQYVNANSVCDLLGEEPAPRICIACIEASSSAVSNTDRMLARGGGEAIGVKMRSVRDVRDWMASLDRSRCPCLAVSSF